MRIKKSSIEIDPSEFLFTTSSKLRKDERAISKNATDSMLKSYGEYSGVGSWIYPHVARATTINHLLEKGADIYHVSGDIGHRDIETTASYAKRRLRM